MKPKLFTEYESQGATFDETRVYRYTLHRMWGGGSLSPWRTVLWIMLNPSTADEHVLDPTLRKCQGFSQRWGYDGFEVCNLFALRSTDPRALDTHPEPIGPGNDAAIAEAISRADLVVVGWGGDKAAKVRAADVSARLLKGLTVHCLKRNSDGSPMHPLYVPYSTEPCEWRPL